MKYCKNCHRMSRDDDFCSHCGSAVYGEDDYSEDIGCNKYPDHSHAKQSYTNPYTSYRPPQNNKPAQISQRPPQHSGQAHRDVEPKKGNGCVTFIAIVIFILIFLSSLDIVPFYEFF